MADLFIKKYTAGLSEDIIVVVSFRLQRLLGFASIADVPVKTIHDSLQLYIDSPKTHTDLVFYAMHKSWHLASAVPHEKVTMELLNKIFQADFKMSNINKKWLTNNCTVPVVKRALASRGYDALKILTTHKNATYYLYSLICYLLANISIYVIDSMSDNDIPKISSLFATSSIKLFIDFHDEKNFMKCCIATIIGYDQFNEIYPNELDYACKQVTCYLKGGVSESSN